MRLYPPQVRLAALVKFSGGVLLWVALETMFLFISDQYGCGRNQVHIKQVYELVVGIRTFLNDII